MESQEKDSVSNAEHIAKTIIQEILERMGFTFEIEAFSQEEADSSEKRIVYNIKTEDSSFLIGQHGVNLDALQHLVRLMFRRQTEEKINLVLDVNGYRQEKNDSVLVLAKSMAEQSIKEKRAVILRPMSSYERRLVHLALLGNRQVSTESIGEGENRKVVIKPMSLI